MDKNQRYRARQKEQGKCPHCGKPCAPYAECEERREAKAYARLLSRGGVCSRCGGSAWQRYGQVAAICRTCYRIKAKQKARGKRIAREDRQKNCGICGIGIYTKRGVIADKCVGCYMAVANFKRQGFEGEMLQTAITLWQLKKEIQNENRK